jgi:hypothetical protein
VLVLLTLFLPIGYSQCGTIRGRDYLLGFGSWPGSLDTLSDVLGRVPYFFTLLLAAFTLLRVLAAQIRPSLLHRSRLNNQLFAAAGTLLLFMLGDFFGFQLASRTWDFLKPRLTGSGQSILMLILATSTIAIAVICLRSRLLRSQRWIVSLFAIAGAISLLVIANSSLALLLAAPIISSDWAPLLAISPSVLYFLIPLGLWHHFGLSQRAGLRTRWPAIRRRIALLYLPVVTFDVFAVGLELRPGRLWGLLPFFTGLGLMFWGYAALQLRLSLTAEERHRRRLGVNGDGVFPGNCV